MQVVVRRSALDSDEPIGIIASYGDDVTVDPKAHGDDMTVLSVSESAVDRAKGTLANNWRDPSNERPIIGEPGHRTTL